jgi:hypothetical protein
MHLRLSAGSPRGMRGPGLKLIPGRGCQPYSRFFRQTAKVLLIAPVSRSQNHPTGIAEPARCRPALPAAWLYLADCLDPEEAPAKFAIRAIRAARADWEKRGYRPAVPGYRSPGEYGQTFEDLQNVA